jgi:hypothetical protein
LVVKNNLPIQFVESVCLKFLKAYASMWPMMKKLLLNLW